MAKDDEIEKILDEVKDYQTSGSGQVIHEVDFPKLKLAIKEYADKQARTTLDSLIDDEIKNYEVYGDDDKICVGIKLMADNIREKYDQLRGNK